MRSDSKRLHITKTMTWRLLEADLRDWPLPSTEPRKGSVFCWWSVELLAVRLAHLLESRITSASPMASQETISVNARSGRRLSLEPKWFLPERSKRSFRNPMAHIRLGSMVAIGLTQRPSSWRPELIGASSRRRASIASSDVESCTGPHVSKPQLWRESASLLSVAATLPARLPYSLQITRVR